MVRKGDIILGTVTFCILSTLIYYLGHPKRNDKVLTMAVNTHSTNTADCFDFSTPEKTLEEYVKNLQKGDVNGVKNCYQGEGFYLSKPVPIKEYVIVKYFVYNQNDIDNLHAENMMPDPPYEIGDVEFQVKFIYSEGESEGLVPYKEDQEEMFSFTLRSIEGKWYLVAHSAWYQD